jgi:hypothetical protein
MAITAKKIGRHRKTSPKKKPYKNIGDLAREVMANVPEADWGKIPRDRGKYVEHYLYGTPKE